jgi:hypothetical protein
MNVIPKLIADNPELLLYLDGKLHITILGGIMDIPLILTT